MFLELLTLANYDMAPPIGGSDLMKAINHLHRSLDLIGGAKKRAQSGVLEEMESWIGAKGNENACANCGKQFAYGDNFCSGCGHKLNETGEGPTIL